MINKKTITSGNLLEVSIYKGKKCLTIRSSQRGVNTNRTNSAQKQLNQRMRNDHITRLIHRNFSSEDIFATLTFASPVSEKKACKNFLDNFIRAAKKHCKKVKNTSYKALGCYEQGEDGQYHIHIIIQGFTSEDYNMLWKFGFIFTEALRINNDCHPLACYFNKGGTIYRTRSLDEPEKVVENISSSDQDYQDMIHGAIMNAPDNYSLIKARSKISSNPYTGLSEHATFIKIKND